MQRKFLVRFLLNGKLVEEIVFAPDAINARRMIEAKYLGNKITGMSVWPQ
ncbi:MAG: hypothetical protein IJY79_05060 [Clostridia bacterium]|nr:hypothetical protein [Clostridia bacterium]